MNELSAVTIRHQIGEIKKLFRRASKENQLILGAQLKRLKKLLKKTGAK